MRFHTRTASLGVVTLLFAASPTAVQQEVALRYRWTAGETLRFRMTQETTTAMSGVPGAGEVGFTQTIAQTLHFKVENVAADGTATITQMVDAITMDMNLPMARISYDSTSPGEVDPAIAPVKEIFGGMIGQPVTLVLSPTGAVQKLEGFDVLLEKVFANAPGGPAMAGLAESLKAMFSDESMRAAFAQGFTQFQDRPTKTGETWHTQYTLRIPTVGALTTSAAFTLKSIAGSGADQVALIPIQLTMTLDPSSAEPNPMGLTTRMDDSTGEGELQFHVGKGRLVRSTVRTTTPMTMSGTAPDGTALNMSMRVTNTTTVEAVDQ